MTFEFFLTNFQKMQKVFEEEGEPMEEDAKIRFMFKQVDHSDPQKSIEALKYHMATNPSWTVPYIRWNQLKMP